MWGMRWWTLSTCNMVWKCLVQIFFTCKGGSLPPYEIRTGIQRGGILLSYGGGQPDYHHHCSWCVMEIWLLYLILSQLSMRIPRMKLKLNINLPVRSNCGNVQHPQHAHFWQLLVDALQGWLRFFFTTFNFVMLWLVVANMCFPSALEAYIMLWFTMFLYIEGC